MPMTQTKHMVVSTIGDKQTIVAKRDTLNEAWDAHRDYLDYLWNELRCSVSDEGKILTPNGEIVTVYIL